MPGSASLRIRMLRTAISLWIAAALPLAAQSVVQAGPSVMRFDDSNGVNFEYPATWTFTEEATWQFGLGIEPIIVAGTPLRGRVFARSLPGVRPWSVTSFSGVEFGYDSRAVDSADACRALALSAFHTEGKAKIDEVTIHGIRYWHGTGGQGAMSQSTSDNVYTTFIGSQLPSGSCLLFDLAVHDAFIVAASRLRPYTPREKSIIHQSLMNIFASVRIPAQSR